MIKFDEMKEQIRQDEVKQRHAMVQRRITIEAAAASVFGRDAASIRFDELDDDQLMVLVIEKIQGENCSGKPSAYLAARLDTAMEGHHAKRASDVERERAEGTAAGRATLRAARQAHSAADAADDARLAMIARHQTAWRADDAAGEALERAKRDELFRQETRRAAREAVNVVRDAPRTLKELVARPRRSLEELGSKVQPSDARADAVLSPRELMVKRQRNAWRSPKRGDA